MRPISDHSQKHDKLRDDCPVKAALDVIRGRWKPLILWNLREGKKRYSDLRKAIPPITEKMLIQHLKQLEADQLVTRTVIEIMPPHVEYDLTASAKELLPALDTLAQWGLRYSET